MKSNIQTFELGVGNDTVQFIYKIELEQDLEKSVDRIASEKIYHGDTIIFILPVGCYQSYIGTPA